MNMGEPQLALPFLFERFCLLAESNQSKHVLILFIITGEVSGKRQGDFRLSLVDKGYSILP